MRALVKRLAARGLTVLLSSHHMDEVEEICDNVTIMSRGQVAYHGTIGQLRTMAPDPGYAVDTGDNVRALGIARRHAGIRVEADPQDALVVTGPRTEVAAYVADLVGSEVELRSFVPTRTPLESLFFMLTDDPAHQLEVAR
jgi:ABC-2 type transport system ATP-binding protein